MKKVFLGTSFSGQVDTHGSILPEFRRSIEQLLEGLRKNELEIFAAVEHEDFMIRADVPPEIGVKKDLDEIDAADVVVALIDDKPSAGLQFELGYAIAKGKQVVLAQHAANHQLAYFNQGAISAGLLTLVEYDTIDALIQQLTVAINAPTQVS
jgi:nucleoside 2-deoxyribosyltransferase